MELCTVNIGATRIPCRVGGKGPALLLVHGLAGSGLWWRRNIAALQQSYRVYVVDLPGFGSLWRDRSGFRLAAGAEWFVRLLDALQLPVVSVAGHSMGGLLAVSLAARAPERVHKLVLVAPSIGLPHQQVRANLRPLMLSVRYVVPSFIPLLAFDTLRAGPWNLWRSARELLSMDLREKLASVEAPTLLIWGERDVLVPPSLGVVLQAAIPLSRLVIIPGAGHVAMFDKPAEFNTAVLQFLAGEPVPA